MKFPWFKQIGIFFLPKSFTGWIIFLAAIVYAVYLFFDIDSRSHSASDTFINFVFNLICITVIYSLIGFFTSRRKN